jgi:hypothetical protein
MFAIQSSGKDGDLMKAAAEQHHISADSMLALSVLAGLAIGGFGGWLLGIGLGNIGLGVTIGATIGLIAGLAGGIVFSDKAE